LKIPDLQNLVLKNTSWQPCRTHIKCPQFRRQLVASNKVAVYK
jgi:hypothetical protein